MAIWQFDFHCLPSASVEQRKGQLPLTLSREEFDRTKWSPRIAVQTVEAALSDLLPEGKTAIPGVRTWGVEDGTRIDLLRDGRFVESVFVRIDVREIPMAFVVKFVAFARANDWVFRTRDGRIVPPSVRRLMAQIETSRSFKYVSDPSGFLEELKRHET